MRKKVRCWKAIQTDKHFYEVYNFVKENKYQLIKVYNRVGIGRHKDYVTEVNDIDSIQWDARQVAMNDWCIFVPDTQEEEKLNKLREIVKNENFLGYKYTQIDNMSAEDIWRAFVLQVLDKMSADNKYRFIKKVILEKLYK